MEDLTIEYFINNDPTFIEEDRKGGGKVFYWQYQVSNNIELPDYTTKLSAIGSAYNFAALNTKPSKYAKEIGWDWNAAFSTGNEPQKLKDLIWEFQKTKILNHFYNSAEYYRIDDKSYKKQKYPQGGTLKSLYNQDPITYTFNSIVVDKTTREKLSGVKIKDLDKQKTTTNPKGEFGITGSFSPGQVQSLIFNLKDYNTNTLVITTLNGSIRSDVNVVELTPNVVDVSSSILKAQGTTEEEKKELTKEEKIEFVKAASLKIINEIKIRLLPFIIKKLLCEPYGVCDPMGLIEMAKEAKEKAKDLNERRKDKKEEKELAKEVDAQNFGADDTSMNSNGENLT